MSLATLLAEPWWLPPLLVTLAHAALLALVGTLLRLTGEWLAALALTQTAAAGSLAALVLGWPPLAGGLAAALSAGAALGVVGHGGAQSQVLLLLGSWAVASLLAANWPVAEQLGHALFDGQVFFAGVGELLQAFILLPLLGAGLLAMTGPSLTLSLFPETHRASHRHWRLQRLVTSLLLAASLAVATASLGLMAAFVLVFVPPLLAWRLVPGWRRSLVVCLLLAELLAVCGFALALLLDQPPGPVLVLLGVLLAVLGRRLPPRQVL